MSSKQYNIKLNNYSLNIMQLPAYKLGLSVFDNDLEPLPWTIFVASCKPGTIAHKSMRLYSLSYRCLVYCHPLGNTIFITGWKNMKYVFTLRAS